MSIMSLTSTHSKHRYVNSHKWRLESHGGMKLCKICKKCYQELKANYSIQRDLLPDTKPISPSVRGAVVRSETRRRSRGRGQKNKTSTTTYGKSTSDLQRELRSKKTRK